MNLLLTREQLEALRAIPPSSCPNRLRVAMALAKAAQSDIVEATGFTQPYISQVVRGRYQTITVENARKFAESFGCSIEDLFPARREVA